MVTLACGPYFSEIGLQASLAFLLLGKPLTYLLFILCFRYRVATGLPLPHRRILKLTAVRTLIGAAALGIAYLVVLSAERMGFTAGLPTAWGLLVAERVIAWSAIGKHGVGLDKRRLTYWTVSGVGIDMAFDFTIVVSSVFGPFAISGVVIALIMFLVPLYVHGRRPSLKSRFLAANICRSCGYDLTGNVSGTCPECGTSTSAAPRGA